MLLAISLAGCASPQEPLVSETSVEPEPTQSAAPAPNESESVEVVPTLSSSIESKTPAVEGWGFVASEGFEQPLPYVPERSLREPVAFAGFY